MYQLARLLVLALAVANINADADAGIAAPHKKFNTQENAGQEARDKLLDDIFANYKTYSYPENTTVQFGVSLLDVHLNDAENTMNVGVWLRMEWNDKRLAWDQEERGVGVLRVPATKVWLPDITLYNSIEQTPDQRMSCWASNALVYSSGKVLWVPPCRLVTYCNLTISDHPYDEQKCTLKFGSWTFDGNTMGLKLWKDETSVDVKDFMGSSQYKLTTNVAKVNEKTYDCCVEPYLDITFDLGFTKYDPSKTHCE